MGYRYFTVSYKLWGICTGTGIGTGTGTGDETSETINIFFT